MYQSCRTLRLLGRAEILARSSAGSLHSCEESLPVKRRCVKLERPERGRRLMLSPSLLKTNSGMLGIISHKSATSPALLISMGLGDTGCSLTAACQAFETRRMLAIVSLSDLSMLKPHKMIGQRAQYEAAVFLVPAHAIPNASCSFYLLAAIAHKCIAGQMKQSTYAIRAVLCTFFGLASLVLPPRRPSLWVVKAWSSNFPFMSLCRQISALQGSDICKEESCS